MALPNVICLAYGSVCAHLAVSKKIGDWLSPSPVKHIPENMYREDEVDNFE